MANISELLQKILNARYGKDVRGSIHDAIQAMNQEIEDDRPTVINSMERAETAAETAEKCANDSALSKETADGSAKMAKSYTHGGTGMRENEDTDNAKYYKEQVENKASLVEEYSQTASNDAQTATEAANRAEQSVNSIGTSVEDAQAAATSAIESASSASNDAQNANASATSALESAQSSSQSASEAQASAEAAARSAEEAKQAAGGDYVTHQEVGQPDGVAGLDENGKVPAEQLPEIGEKVVVDGKTIVKDEKTGEISVADEVTKSISDTQKSILDHTDSLVMSAEGVHGLRYHEDKLEAKDSEGTWHEIETGGGGGGIPLAEPTNVLLENADESVVIKWTDPDDIVVSGSTIAKWDGTVIVRKVGSAPTSKTDGVLIIDSKVKNQYATNGYIDNGLNNGTEYFYGFFPYTDKNVYTTTKVSSITPSEIYPTAPSNVSAEKGNALATVSFTLAEDASSAKIVYGTHAPTSPSDGTAIETTISPYTIEGLVNDTTYYIVVYAFNAKGRYTASDIVEVTPKSLEIVTFADGTDEEIAKMVQAHYNDEINLSDYWAVGDTRNVALSSMSATGVGESHRAQTVQFVIGDFEHDDLTTPINGHTKAAVTLLQKDCLMDATNASSLASGSSNTENGYMNSSNTNVNGWRGSARRTWCNNVYYNALPSIIINAIKDVNKKTSVGNNSSSIETTIDKIFLASEVEIFGSTKYSFAGEGTQYTYYKNATANRYKMPKWSSSYVSNIYCERSPRGGDTANFCNVNIDGSASYNGASNAIGLAPCLCI